MRSRTILVAAVASALLLGACSLLVDTSELAGGASDAGAGAEAFAGESGMEGGSGDDAATTDGAPTDATSAADADASAPCPTGRGPTMVRVPAGAGSFCIDTTEVTNAHWAAFLADKGGDTSGQPAECAWNASYVPANTADAAPVWPPAASKDPAPVVNVDWCDARAFCVWAGKRLCGRIGGGSHAFAEPGDAATGEWTSACSRGGTRTFPYGNTFQSALCNDKPRGVGTVVTAGSINGCVGGYDGLFDMSGNAEEWEDSCNGTSGATDMCHRRGGSFADSVANGDYRCDEAFQPAQRRDRADSDVGVRCCAD